jgi:AcrR family transcriptional regulator
MTTTGALDRRPKRADARRNYDALTEASLEDIARRAGVGIGTLYRHFPTRQALLEATYLEEVEALCASAAELSDLEPWDALVSWLNRFARYAATKKALAAELLATIGMESDFFAACHTSIFAAGEPLLERAQAAGAVRPDVTFNDAVRLVSGILMVRVAEPEEIDRLMSFALDGLRYRPDPAS